MNPFEKNPLIPTIIQDQSGTVRMLGYMNKEALEATLAGENICFFSRSKNRLWVKGETSGNFLKWKNYAWDCDEDTLLFTVEAQGPSCHTGTITCFGAKTLPDYSTLTKLEETLANRRSSPTEQSYVASLIQAGTHKIAQKVGEEATELVIESLMNNDTDFVNEAADLLFHYLLLLQQKGFTLKDVLLELQTREK